MYQKYASKRGERKWRLPPASLPVDEEEREAGEVAGWERELRERERERETWSGFERRTRRRKEEKKMGLLGWEEKWHERQVVSASKEVNPVTHERQVVRLSRLSHTRERQAEDADDNAGDDASFGSLCVNARAVDDSRPDDSSFGDDLGHAHGRQSHTLERQILQKQTTRSLAPNVERPTVRPPISRFLFFIFNQFFTYKNTSKSFLNFIKHPINIKNPKLTLQIPRLNF